MDAHPLAALRSECLRSMPWGREPMVCRLRHATRGWGDDCVAQATAAVATLPVPRCSKQSWTQLCCRVCLRVLSLARFAHAVGAGSLMAARLAALVGMGAGQPPSVSTQAIRLLVIGWTRTRRTGPAFLALRLGMGSNNMSSTSACGCGGSRGHSTSLWGSRG